MSESIGNGTLTAEQVRDAIERHSAWVIGNNRCFHNGAYEAIADELSATLGCRKLTADDYALENMLLKIDNDTRWYELFGTPERAARTMMGISERVNFDGIGGDYDTVLKWLRGDA